MTQFNVSTHEKSAIRHPSYQASPTALVPSLDELALQQNWEQQQQQQPQNNQHHIQPQAPVAPLIDFLDAPDAPVLMAQTSDDSDGGLALFATLLTTDQAAHVMSAQRAECRLYYQISFFFS